MNVLTSIWDDIAARKLYITGGIGAQGGGESFGSPYFLPNERSYCETCASIAFVLFNQRMFQLTGDAKYIDMLERSLYNALLAGYAITGEKFFYPNPLASSGRHERSEWFECACCPPNVARFIATVPGYMYATKGNTVYVNLYGASVMHTVMGDVPVEITQKTEYPWEGAITLSVKPAKEVNGALALRIPGWARNEVMPGDLYLFEKESMQQPEISINGEKADLKIQSGYAIVKRDWKAGDTIEMQLPMPVRRIWSNPAIRTNKDLAAFQRGPIVYCAEWPDNSKHVFDLCLPVGTELKPEYNPELFNGIMTLKGKAELIYYPEGSTNTAKAEQEVTLIPYYAWAHRGRGEMAVWLVEKEIVARPV